MAFQYADIEDELVSRVQSFVPEAWKVMIMPTKENELALMGSKLVIVIAFYESAFLPPTGMGLINQEETVTLIANIRAAALRGPNGVQSAIEMVKQILLGYKTAYTDKLFLDKIELEERDPDRNFFSYNVIFKAKKKQVETPDPEQELPKLKQLTFNTKTCG